MDQTIIAGMLVPGLGYLALRGAPDAGGLFLLLPLLLYGLASILSVEIPDVEADLLAHKATWLARMGRASGFLTIGWLRARRSTVCSSMFLAWACC